MYWDAGWLQFEMIKGMGSTWDSLCVTCVMDFNFAIELIKIVINLKLQWVMKAWVIFMAEDVMTSPVLLYGVMHFYVMVTLGTYRTVMYLQVYEPISECIR